jgi:hypothetical protein
MTVEDRKESLSQEARQKALREFYRYGLELVLEHKEDNHMFSCEPVDMKTAFWFLDFFVKELSIYSVGLINKTRLDRVVFCRDPKLKGTQVLGRASMVALPNEFMWVRSVAFHKNTIYLDASKGQSLNERITIHHELFHAIDSQDDIWYYLDPEWLELNAPGFEYSRGNNCRNEFKPGQEGFLTEYSMEAVHEDKAEVYGHMIVDYAGVERRAATDPIIKAKVERIKEILNSFSPHFDAQFWRQRAKASTPVFEP